MNLVEMRIKGIGSNFSVLNPEDGFRKDNSVWFGTCSKCGEMVSNSRFQDAWTHSVVVETIGTTGKVIKSIDYCPKA